MLVLMEHAVAPPLSSDSLVGEEAKEGGKRRKGRLPGCVPTLSIACSSRKNSCIPSWRPQAKIAVDSEFRATADAECRVKALVDPIAMPFQGQTAATGDESVAGQHARNSDVRGLVECFSSGCKPEALAVRVANAHAAHAHACNAGDGCTVQDLRVQTRQGGFSQIRLPTTSCRTGAAMSPQITSAPTIPTLHSVMTG